MSVLDTAVLNEIQYHVIETPNSGASWTSLWTQAEILNYFNERQTRLLKDTQVVLTRVSLWTIPNVTRHPLPADWLTTSRVAWQTSPGAYSPIPRATGYESDLADSAWDYDHVRIPTAYTEVDTPNLQIQLQPASFDNGLIDLLYTAVGTTLTAAGVALVVPDDAVWIVKWGVVADMLWKLGHAHDPARAAYAEARYTMGVALLRSILEGGWF